MPSLHFLSDQTKMSEESRQREGRREKLEFYYTLGESECNCLHVFNFYPKDDDMHILDRFCTTWQTDCAGTG